MRKAKVVKPSTRKPTITKEALHTEIKRLTDEIEWGKKIVAMQQAEIDRMIKLNDSLTTSINNISKWDH